MTNHTENEMIRLAQHGTVIKILLDEIKRNPANEESCKNLLREIEKYKTAAHANLK